MTFSIEAALDDYVRQQSPPREFDGLWHPSSISGCQRKAVYEIRQVPPSDPKQPKQLRVLYVGTMMHTLFQAAVEAHQGVKAVHTEVQVLISDLNTGGSGDQLVIFDDDESELEEFKTIAPFGFTKLTEPKEDHADQIRPYMFALREFGGIDQDGNVVPPQGDKLRRVRFTYIDKVNLDTKEYTLEWDPEWEEKLRDKVAVLDTYKANPASLPPRLPLVKGKKDYRCDWGWGKCEFFTRCWNTDPEEVEPEF